MCSVEIPTSSILDAHTPELINKLSTAIATLHTSTLPGNVLPSHQVLSEAREHLKRDLPEQGAGLEDTIRHLTHELGPALNASSRSPAYYGFVTGGSTPAASFADNLVTHYDQNVQVHLPSETLATEIEDRALTLLCSLLEFTPSQWPHRTFTTGATASNIVGLACGREYIIAEASAHRTDAGVSVGEHGIMHAMRLAGIDNIQILTTVPHSSLSKAASILGMGRSCVKTIARTDAPHKFDMDLLKKHLAQPGAASIVAISASEVNTGLFATSSLQEMQALRRLCDMHGAWIHVDGAFGIQARLLPSISAYQSIKDCTAGLELADSITGDGHKLLNVPYDCGFFLSRHRSLAERVFSNPNAAYLAAGSGRDGVMSPLNVGLENSRRFRALPVYASLVAYGKAGYRDMLERQIALSRSIAQWIMESEDYELLPHTEADTNKIIGRIYIIVLFRAVDENLNEQLIAKIKASRRIYVSGTSWAGRPACRFAVSNWMVDVDRDLGLIKQVLMDVARARDGTTSFLARP
ncbi:pyridoxal-dependent decarboxylase [Didymella exigua CBS 183.55]|uniref:Pyridoxal-dependent decarboxylase n=1 Tax=Didymella exigua CBS 183.55 TaxID=1150837 RepID=A0A6A5RD54_9PLEO|nr:pyridoxal-dependent decarboxylase [Didymella exigua CBS 183.55]KAF1923637.1 pyridoxal-dependent decarboxylase [Didymella exigua CBS 183.55]